MAEAAGTMNRPDVDILEALEKCLYNLPRGACGGPLHVVLDDGNMDDESLDWSEANLMRKSEMEAAGYSESYVHLARAILFELRQLTAEERRAWYERRR